MTRLAIATNLGRVWAFVNNVHHIGIDLHIDDTVQLGSAEFPIEDLYLGDHVSLFGPSKFLPRKMVVGDYVKIYDGCWAGGDAQRNGHDERGGELYVGHNCWFAPRCILDPTGGMYIGNNFGAGCETHLWSHIRHGDVMAGCKYLSYGKFVAENDVWFVGRATGNPVWCESKSVAMTGAMVVSDMEHNSIYGGVPAKDLTEKIGRPWKTGPPDYKERWDIFEKRLMRFQKTHDVTAADLAHLCSRFDIMNRTYRKGNAPLEVALMRQLLPEIKFVPEGENLIAQDVIKWPTR